jgi:hypothetical protein
MIKSESVFPRHIMVRRRRDRMVVGFTTTCAISTYCEADSHACFPTLLSGRFPRLFNYTTERKIPALVYLHY